MKVLHIAGWSGSGKTTFILKLCAHLVSFGKTATIKHIGSHYSTLPPGKDTTLHFESGADPAIGIDKEKTSAIFHAVDCDAALNMLSDFGVRYAIVEGFKKKPFQKVLIGEMDCNYLVKNPEVFDVIAILDYFDDWYTLSGLTQELIDQFPGKHCITWTGYTHSYLKVSGACEEIEENLKMDPGILGIRLRVQKWADNNRHPVYLVIMTKNPLSGMKVLSQAMVRLAPYMDTVQGSEQ